MKTIDAGRLAKINPDIIPLGDRGGNWVPNVPPIPPVVTNFYTQIAYSVSEDSSLAFVIDGTEHTIPSVSSINSFAVNGVAIRVLNYPEEGLLLVESIGQDVFDVSLTGPDLEFTGQDLPDGATVTITGAGNGNTARFSLTRLLNLGDTYGNSVIIKAAFVTADSWHGLGIGRYPCLAESGDLLSQVGLGSGPVFASVADAVSWFETQEFGPGSGHEGMTLFEVTGIQVSESENGDLVITNTNEYEITIYCENGTIAALSSIVADDSPANETQIFHPDYAPRFFARLSGSPP